MICTFFGHRDVPSKIKFELIEIISNLIEKENATVFYVGNQGNFDFYVKTVLEDLKEKYTQIDYFVVLAYLPVKKECIINDEYKNTIYPESIETVPPKFAISWRNKWMIERSDIVVTYVNKPYGGAYNAKELAKRKHKKIVEIAGR